MPTIAMLSGVLTQDGLSGAHWRVYMSLFMSADDEARSTQTISDLARNLNLTPRAVERVLRSLREKGLICRDFAPGDSSATTQLLSMGPVGPGFAEPMEV